MLIPSMERAEPRACCPSVVLNKRLAMKHSTNRLQQCQLLQPAIWGARAQLLAGAAGQDFDRFARAQPGKPDR
jgi:hypothetical protein